MAAVIKDIKTQNRMCVLYSLALLSDGILKYFQDQYIIIHGKLKVQNQHLNTPCTISCSKNHQDQRNWCATCSSWKTSILSLHRNPNARRGNIDWKQFDSSKWPTDPMEVKKCFEPEWCRAPGSNPNLLDISIIVGCMSNCSHFCLDVKQIREIRNTVSHNNKLTKEKKKAYCQTLLDFIQHADIWKYQDAKDVFNDIVIFRDTTLEIIFENHLLDGQRLDEIESRLFSRKTSIEHLISVIISKKDILCAVLFVILGVLCVKMYNKKEECNYGYKTEFKSYLDQHNNFTGREWLFNGIKERLKSSERGLILVADLGYGKTASVAQIINKKQNIGDFDMFPYICRSDVKTLQLAAPFLLRLFQHLLCNYPSFVSTIREKISITAIKDLENWCKFDPLYFLDHVIIDNLLRMEPPTGSGLLVLIDALDECKSRYKDDSILSILRLRHQSFPRWVRLFFTARNDSTILSDFHSLSKWHLTRYLEENKKDVIKFVQKSYLVTAATAEKIALHFEYNFLLTKFVLRDKKKKDMVASLPLTLNDAFKKEFNILFDNCNPNKFRKSRFILEVFIASFQPLKIEELFSLVSVSASEVQFYDGYEFEDILQKMLPHILQMSEDGHVTLFHSLLAGWLTHPGRRGHPCFVDKQNGHKTITNALMKKIVISGNEADRDSVNLLIDHLYVANDTVLFEKFKGLRAGIVDKTMNIVSFYRSFYLSSLDIAAKRFNSYKLFKTILCLSKSKNVTQAAQYSIVYNNTDSLRAILESGHVDVSARQEIFDLTESVYSRNRNKSKEIDAFTVLHSAIALQNFKAFKLIIEYNSSALHFDTRNGASVLEVAVFYDAFQILKLCLEYLPIKENILALAAAWFTDHRSVKLLQQHGAKDVCLKCETDIFIRKNREIYFEKYNKTITIDEKRWLKDNGDINHPIDSVVLNFFRQITCECVLHIAVSQGNSKLVDSILHQSTSTIECVDFQGLTPLAGAVIFQKHDIVEYLLDKGANVNFVCDPTDVMNRVNMLRQLKVYSVVYNDLYFDEYCPKGASIGHLISLNPTCEVIKVVLGYVNNIELFFQKDKKGRNPIYYFLCQKQKWGKTYIKPEEFVSQKQIQMLLFLIVSIHGNFNNSRLLIETGVCGNQLQITNTNIFQSICSYSPEKIPELGELFIKVDTTIHTQKDIAHVFPVKKEVILEIMHSKGVKETETIISLTSSPEREHFKNSMPSSMQHLNEIGYTYMSLFLEKLEQIVDELNVLNAKQLQGITDNNMAVKNKTLFHMFPNFLKKSMQSKATGKN